MFIFLCNLAFILCRQEFHYTVDHSLISTLTEDLLTRKNGFISELVSNSLDAINKTTRTGQIVVKIEDNKFMLRDNGIGMDQEDIVNFIGSIGSSSSRDNEKAIGRFGLGFYSVFKYAEKVIIYTRKAGKKGYMATFEKKNQKFYIEESDVQFEGTEIVAYIHGDTAIAEKDLEEWVNQNMIPAGDNNSIVLEKSEAQLAAEKEKVIADYNKRVKEHEEKMKAKEEALKKKEEERLKRIENGETLEEEENEIEEEKKEVLESLESLLSKVSPTMNLKFAPWTNQDEFDQLSKIYNERFNTGALNYAKKFTFYVNQKNSNQVDVSTRFDAIVFIPKLNAMTDNPEGKIELFVSGTKIVDPNFKMTNSLAFVSAIVKSNEALITSTREGFYDSENTCKNIINALQRRIRDIFISKTDEEIHAYNKTIKKAYIENYQAGNTSICEKFASLLTFETNSTIKSIHKLVAEIKKINASAKETNTKEIESVYYTNTLISLVKETDNPLFDGIDVPYVFLNDIHDEEIVRVMKTYEKLPLVNISTVKFENKTVSKEQEEAFKPVLAEIKKTLSSYITDVFISKRLLKVPFSIMPTQNSMSSSYKNIIGENELEKHPFRQYIDPKPTLEVNLDSKEIIALKENMNEISVLKMFIAASLACKVDIYNRAACVNSLMDSARMDLGIETVPAQKPADEDETEEKYVSTEYSEDIEQPFEDSTDIEEVIEEDADILEDQQFDTEVAEEKASEAEMSDKVEDSKLDTATDDELKEESSDEADETEDVSDIKQDTGDYKKDLFNSDKMKELQDMLKNDEYMQSMLTPEKMKEMEGLFKDDKFKDLFNDESFKDMFNDENNQKLLEEMKGSNSDYARDEL